MKKILAILVACLMPICLIAGSGDVNGDGKIDVADIVELLNHLNGNPTKNYQATEADANNDGVVDQIDVETISDMILAVKINGMVSLPDGVDDTFLQSCEVSGVSDNYELQDNTSKIYNNPNGLVQTYFLTDGDKTYLACRVSQIEDGGEIAIGVESSAIALATLHPLFAPINGSDYDIIVGKIKNSSKYMAFYQEVENAIKANRDLFDDSNEALINSLDELYDDVLSDIDFDAYQNASAMSLSRSATRAAYESPAIIPTYFYADITGNTLTLQCRGLTPSYYGTVTSALTGEVWNYAVTSRSDYGGMDMFKPYNQFNLGDKCSFTFTTEGEHQFSLSRTNTAATVDFYMRLANSVLNIIGLNFGDKTVIREIANTISNAMLAAGMNALMTASGVHTASFMDWFGVAYKATIDYLKRDTNILVKRGLIGNLQVYAKILYGAWNIYGKIKGVANIGARLAYAAVAPDELNFCLCYYSGSVYECVEASLLKISGDKQEGNANESLPEPLKVYVQIQDEYGLYHKPSPFLKVKFEVENGGGIVQSDLVTINDDNTAFTYWTLGSSGIQTVNAVVWDIINECEVSNPVHFTASLDEIFDETASYLSCPDENHPHWIDLGLPSGTLWRCCNEGASTPEAYGGYYEFGQVASAPSYYQIKELLDYTTSEWMTRNGVQGTRFAGGNGGTIFLPAAGYRWVGEFYNVGTGGRYWSSTPDDSETVAPGIDACGLTFCTPPFLFDVYSSSSYRSHGYSVRSVR